ncbi:MAG: AbrB/MazE/SpoVT family DNA-binding domain-containing protein [Desulfurobacteriaceae bacterium]
MFKSGNSWTLRLAKEVYIKRERNRIVLIPKEKKWDVLFEKLEEVKEETKNFLIERSQPDPQEKELF